MNNFTKRLWVGMLLGMVFGLLCTYLASTHGVPGAFDWSSAMFWNTVFNRMTLGALIGMYGVFKVHPMIPKMKLGPVLRGIDGGMWISLLLATGSLIGGDPNRWYIFWLIMIMGAIFGVVIDLILTKLYGDGSQLLDYQDNTQE